MENIQIFYHFYFFPKQNSKMSGQINYLAIIDYSCDRMQEVSSCVRQVSFASIFFTCKKVFFYINYKNNRYKNG